MTRTIHNQKMRIATNYKQAGTHIPVLIKAVNMTDGDVCEVGSGFFSTPLLHWLVKDRRLVTYENNKDYLDFAKDFQTGNHIVDTTENMDFERPWSVVFIDHSCKLPHTRGADALKFVNAKMIVLHDTELENQVNYGYDTLWKHFKYRYDLTECKPYTSVVSNYVDVSKLFTN